MSKQIPVDPAITADLERILLALGFVVYKFPDGYEISMGHSYDDGEFTVDVTEEDLKAMFCMYRDFDAGELRVWMDGSHLDTERARINVDLYNVSSSERLEGDPVNLAITTDPKLAGRVCECAVEFLQKVSHLVGRSTVDWFERNKKDR